MEDDYINKKFKVYVPLTKASRSEEDGRLYLHGVASTTDKDYDDDQMEESAIESMKRQAVSGITGFEGHDYGLSSIFGKVVAVKETGKDLFAPIFRVRKSKEAEIQELIDDGIKLGLSIGGVVKDAVTEKAVRRIKDVLLIEISLTPIPANNKTLGTVSVGSINQTTKAGGCKGDICRQIFKSIETKYMKAAGYDLNSSCFTFAMAQIKAGNYNKSDGWSFNDAKDGGDLLGKDSNITRYGKAHLAVDKNRNLETKAAYHFPIGKLSGGNVVIYRAGIAAAAKAAGGARSGVTHSAIADACDKLLAAMDKQEKAFKQLEDNKMEKEDIEAIINGVAAKNEESNKQLLEGVSQAFKEAMTPPEGDPGTGTGAEGDNGAAEAGETHTVEEITAAVKTQLLKELKGEEEPAKEEPDAAYKEIVKGIATDVLAEIRKARPMQRQTPPADNGDDSTPTKKTQTVQEAAEKLAKQANPLGIQL